MLKLVSFVLLLSVNALAANLDGKSFIHQIGSDEECAAWQHSDPIFNCYQKISFSNGKATVLMTDILNVEPYKIDGNTVTIHVSEFGTDLVFELSRNQKVLTLKDGGSAYLLQSKDCR